MTASVRDPRLRRASRDDADLLLGWANDPATREASFGRGPIEPAEHLAWLAAVIEDPRRRLWIAEVGGQPVGQIRVDRQPDGVGVISIGLAPEARGHGLGQVVLRLGLAASAADLEIGRARATVRLTNVASRRLFETAGFSAVGESGEGDRAAAILEREVGPDAPAPR